MKKFRVVIFSILSSMLILSLNSHALDLKLTSQAVYVSSEVLDVGLSDTKIDVSVLDAVTTPSKSNIELTAKTLSLNQELDDRNHLFVLMAKNDAVKQNQNFDRMPFLF